MHCDASEITIGSLFDFAAVRAGSNRDAQDASTLHDSPSRMDRVEWSVEGRSCAITGASDDPTAAPTHLTSGEVFDIFEEFSPSQIAALLRFDRGAYVPRSAARLARAA